MAVVAIVVGIAGSAGVAIYAVTLSDGEMGRIHALEGRLRAATSVSEAASANHRALAAQSSVERLAPRVRALTVCLPELQAEIDGLGVGYKTGFGERDEWWITNSRQISQPCNAILYEGPEDKEEGVTRNG